MQNEKRAQDKEYRFHNPYNFVRPIPKPRPDSKILGNVPPPPHDRYIGLSGHITCTVKAETLLFVSDSHGISSDKPGEKKQHNTYRFFQYDGKPAIPATTLRGMIRNVYETVTNSCFAVFDGERQLEHRKSPRYALKLKAGIVRSLPKDGQDGEIELLKYAKAGAYRDEQYSVLSKDLINKIQRLRHLPKSPNYKAIIRKTNRNIWQVVKITEIEKALTRNPTGNEKEVEGWLKITGKNFPKKKDEYFFYKDPGVKPNTVKFNNKILQEYNAILKGQAENEQIKPSFRKTKLEENDLVWVEEENGKVKRISRVKVPRVQYPKPLKGYLSDELKHLLPCMDYEHLCPACRLFGWVNQEKASSGSKDKIRAFAGRIRISHATLKSDAKYMGNPIPLAILASPKPTTELFYLANKKGCPDKHVSYNNPNNARLRGRKMYWHHSKPDEKEYTRVPFKGSRCDHQNRTIKDAVKKGTEFRFDIEFHNLAPVELGALIYVLELEEGMHHRLGLAKPLGFGSVSINIDELELIDWKERFQAIELEAGRNKIDTGKIRAYREGFLSEMEALYGNHFKNMMSDLRAILSGPNTKLPIHYPRSTPDPTPEGKNFEWFMGNKKRRIPLPLASEDKQGFPLLDR